LGLELVAKAYKVGLLDVDITGSNLFSALGLEHSPKWGLDSVKGKIIVPEVNGYWLLSIASHVGEDYAVLWEASHHEELSDAKNRIKILESGIERLGQKVDMPPIVLFDNLESIRRQIDDVLASSKWRFVSELLSPEIVTWPEPLDFMVADCPPSTSAELFSFLDQTKDLFGVVIVSQPTKISTIGLVRTIDLLRARRIPIIGLVANQDGFLNRHGEIEYQFLSPRVDLKDVATNAQIPFLLSIPQTGDSNKLKPYFSELADKVVGSSPVVLKRVTFKTKLKRKIVKGIARRL